MKDARDKRELLKLQREWLNAYQKHDAAALERIEDNELTLTEAEGKVTTEPCPALSILNWHCS